MSEEEYTLSEITSFGQYLNEGSYVGKVIEVLDGTTKGGHPKVTATLEVTEGPSKGLTFDKQYILYKHTTKKGATTCMGIDDLRNDARALGVSAKLPKSFTVSGARKVFASILTSSKKIEFDIRKVPDSKDPSKEWSRAFITGKAGLNSDEAFSAMEGTDSLEDAFA